MRQIRTEIDISATAERVWAILTDFASFPLWNPFIRSASGGLAVGDELELSVSASGTKPVRARPRIVSCSPQQELSWRTSMLAPGLFDGVRTLTLDASRAGHVQFIQAETFSGLLVPLFVRHIETDVRRGFKEMNRALKQRAEQAPAAAPDA